MYQEIGRSAIVHNKRVIAHATLDAHLNILSYSPELCEWSCLAPDTFAGSNLFSLFPQLEPSHDLVFQALQDPENVFVYQNVHFAQNHDPNQVFDLQLEPISELPNKLLLTVVPLVSQLENPEMPSSSDKNLVALSRRNRELLLLNRASQILTATLNAEEVLERLLQVTAQIINATASSVWLWHDDSQEHLVCRAAFHPGTEERLVGMLVASGQGVVGWVAETNEGTIVVNPATDGRFYPHIDTSSGFVTKSILAVPIHLRDRILGVLEVVNKRDGDFLPSDLAYAEMLAASAAIAIDNAQLIETLRQKMADLKTQNDELEAFDHTVAHDLQNPLALVVGFADLLQTKGIHISQTEQERSLALLVQNAHRMSNIIQELLMLSSVRKRDVETHPLDMSAVVLGALDRLRFTMEQHKVRIILPDSWAVARGYAPWIEEVWENYLSNALKYGGDPPQIELGDTVLPDGRIKFWVRDNGQGIPREKLPLLFTPFTKLSEVRVTGHGLGLSIVRRIVEKLGGQVDVESKIGEGSTFGFILPPYHHVEK